MEKTAIQYGKYEIEYFSNESKSKDLILFLHGLDGSAEFAKPLFKELGDEFKIVAIQQRGHHNSNIPASRMISKHIKDVQYVINYFKNQGYRVWLMGESMGGALATLIGYKLGGVEGVFSQSIPNRIVNTQTSSKKDQFVTGLKTFTSFITNIEFKNKQAIDYEKMTNNRVLIRLARMADESKLTSARERLMTWALIKRVWRLFKSHKTPKVPVYYFAPDQDIFCHLGETIRALGKKENPKLQVVKNSKHILMYEENYWQVYDTIRHVIEKRNEA